MSTSFQERFKGKTVLMTKDGVDGVIKDSDNPIPKAAPQGAYQMEDFTSHQRYANSKKESQTFDQMRPMYNSNEAQNGNIYSITYSNNLSNGQGPFQSVQHHRSSNNQNMDSIDHQMEQLKAVQRMQQQEFLQNQMKQVHKDQQFSSKQYIPPSENYLMQGQPTGHFGKATSSSNNSAFPSQSATKKFNYQQDLNSNTVPVQLFSNNNNLGGVNVGYSNNQQAGSANTTAASINRNIPNGKNTYVQQSFNPYKTPVQGSNSNIPTSIEDFQQIASEKQIKGKNFTGELYKPYTLNEYKNIQKGANYKLGGLGPNIGNDEWSQKKEQIEKRQEFAKNVQQFNTQILKSQQEQGKVAAPKIQKEVSTREKALEFARNIPKPPLGAIPFSAQIPQQPRSSSNAPIQRKKDTDSQGTYLRSSSKTLLTDVDQLEKNHLQFLNEIEKMSKQQQ